MIDYLYCIWWLFIMVFLGFSENLCHRYWLSVFSVFCFCLIFVWSFCLEFRLIFNCILLFILLLLYFILIYTLLSIYNINLNLIPTIFILIFLNFLNIAIFLQYFPSMKGSNSQYKLFFILVILLILMILTLINIFAYIFVK